MAKTLKEQLDKIALPEQMKSRAELIQLAKWQLNRLQEHEPKGSWNLQNMLTMNLCPDMIVKCPDERLYRMAVLAEKTLNKCFARRQSSY